MPRKTKIQIWKFNKAYWITIGKTKSIVISPEHHIIYNKTAPPLLNEIGWKLVAEN